MILQWSLQVIPLPAEVGKDFLFEATGGTPREMRFLFEYLQDKEKSAASVYSWIDDRSKKLLKGIERFVKTKLDDPDDRAKFSDFLQWYISPASMDVLPPQGIA